MYSTLLSLLSVCQRLVRRSSRRPSQSPGRRAFRPSLECLEDRWVPTTLQVGSGKPNSFATITSALGAAKAGDTILIYPGTYQEAVDITTKNITLEGTSQSGVIIEPPAATSPPPPVTASTVKAAAVVTPPTGSSLASNNYALVQVNGVTGVTIENLTVSGPYSGGTSTVVSDGTTNYLGMHAGIFISNGGSATISDNVVSDIRDATPNTTNNDGFAILVGSESDVLHTTGTATITGNTIKNYQSVGVTIGGPGSSATIRDNTITGLGATLGNQYLEQFGIAVQPGGTANIAGNTVSNNALTNGNTAIGIYLDNAATSVNVTGNTVTGNNVGFELFSQTGGSITGNQVNHNSVGIEVFSGTGGSLTANQFSNNTGDGIDLFSTSGMSLLGNIVNGNGGTGITLSSATDNVFLLNSVTNSGFVGFFLFSSTDNTFLLNAVDHNSYDGFYVDSGSTGNLFALNAMSNNGHDGAEDFSSGSGTDGTANFWLFNSAQPVHVVSTPPPA